MSTDIEQTSKGVAVKSVYEITAKSEEVQIAHEALGGFRKFQIWVTDFPANVPLAVGDVMHVLNRNEGRLVPVRLLWKVRGPANSWTYERL